MIRYYDKQLGPWAGMSPDLATKRENQATYMINVDGPTGEKRLGNGVWGGGPVAGTDWTSCNGGCQFVFPRGTTDSPFGSMVVACADANSLGRVYEVTETSVTQLNSAVPFNSGATAKYHWAYVHGKLYGINEFTPPFVISPLATALQKFAMVTPVDGFENSPLHICALQLPAPKMIGSFNSQLVLANFQAGAGPYPTTGEPWVIDANGPVTAIFSEAVTDLDQIIVFQVKEYFAFTEAIGQQLVGQWEYKDKNLFWCSGSVWQLIGSLASEFYAVPLTRVVGAAAAETIRETDPGMVWMAQDGFYLYDGGDVKKISKDLDPIFGELLFSLSSNPYLLDRGKMWDACSRVNKKLKKYETWVSLAAYDGQKIKFTWDFGNNTWSIGGKGTVTRNGVASTTEVGENARAAWMYKDEDEHEFPMFAGSDGFVHRGRIDCKDNYEEQTVSAAVDSTHFRTAMAHMLTTNADDKYNGAMLTILDDRTSGEKTAGTWPTGRIPAGTTYTVSDGAFSGGVYTFTLSSAMAIQPQVGCSYSLHWPVGWRWLDVLGYDDTATIIRLLRLILRVIAATNENVTVWYEGNPLNWNPDMPLQDLPGARQVTLKNAADDHITDFIVNCGPPRNVGRYIQLGLEGISDETFSLLSVLGRHGFVGYK